MPTVACPVTEICAHWFAPLSVVTTPRDCATSGGDGLSASANRKNRKRRRRDRRRFIGKSFRKSFEGRSELVAGEDGEIHPGRLRGGESGIVAHVHRQAA